MKLARTILAPILLLVLLLAQLAPARDVSVVPSKMPCCCHQAKCCCQSQPSSNSERVPAAAARTNTQSDWQIVTAVAEHIVSNFSSPQQNPMRIQPVVAAAIVPLYQRNCALLI